MSTPELPPPNAYFWTPKPGSGLRPELKSWSTNCGPHPQWDVVGYYTAEEVAAAVLAERERCANIIGTYQVPVGNSRSGELAAEWTMDALREVRAAIRAEPPKEQP